MARQQVADLLLSAINQTIDEWDELQHVIAVFGAGGTQSGEKLLWMGDVIFEFYKDIPIDIVEEDIHEYVAQLVDNEFNFVCMDNSLDLFVDKVKEYHKLWTEKSFEKMKEIMSARKKASDLKKIEIQKDTESINETMGKLALDKEVKSENKLSSIDEDGWTVVTSKKKNKPK